MSLSRLWFATRVGLRMILLPLFVRGRALPVLLRCLSGEAAGQSIGDSRQLLHLARIVARVSRIRLFDLPIFPRPCLRRSLTLYSVLARRGYPVEIHFGVRTDGRDLHGHSWVTVQGTPLGERAPAEAFRTIYSYPSVSFQSHTR